MKHNMMHRKSGRLVGFVLVVTLLCLTGITPVSASAAPDRHKRYMVLGTIESIDSAANTITVRLSDGTDKTLQLAKRLMVNGREEAIGRAESALTVQERALIYYKDDTAGQTVVDVESLKHAMRRTVTGTLISSDKDKKIVVLRMANGKEETFRLQNEAVIETPDNVTTFDRFDPQAGVLITLHYEDSTGVMEASRIKH